MHKFPMPCQMDAKGVPGLLEGLATLPTDSEALSDSHCTYAAGHTKQYLPLLTPHSLIAADPT